jgi:hypothetical protein
VIVPLVAALFVTVPVPKTEGDPFAPSLKPLEFAPAPNAPTVTVYEVPAEVT